MSDDHALVIVAQPSTALMPVMGIEDAKAAYEAVKQFVESILKEGTDFGKIPGTGDKPTLLKPGAEKFARFFGLSTRFVMDKEIEDWEADEPFFYYRVKCQLYRMGSDTLAGEGLGSCNSREKKYRYRNAEYSCPECGVVGSVLRSKNKGEGFFCWSKKGGCGFKFAPNDPRITGQERGQVINPDIPEQVNTILKMAQKRAMIAAVLVACNASDYFTQDVEDLDYGGVEPYTPPTVTRPKPETVIDGEEVKPPATAPTKGKAEPEPAEAHHKPAPTVTRPYDADTYRRAYQAKVAKRGGSSKAVCSTEQAQFVAALMSQAFEDSPTKDKDRYAVLSWLTGREIASTKQLTIAEASVLLDRLTDGVEDGDLSPESEQELTCCMVAALVAQGQTELPLASGQ